MEVLHVLEEKIARLIESKKKDMGIIAELRKELISLTNDNNALKEQVEQLKNSLLLHNADVDAINRERKNAQLAVDELIGCIDALIAEESQS